MPQLLNAALRSPQLMVWLGSAIVAVATWQAAQNGKWSALLFFLVLFSGGIVRSLGSTTDSAYFVVVAFLGALLFLLPLALRRTPKSPEEKARFSISTCVWLLAYVTALFWFGDFALK